jgi:hypothetical protein
MPNRRWWTIAPLGLALLACAGCPTIVVLEVFGTDTYSDRYATIGEFFNPLGHMGPCASTTSYIKVGGRRYKYHDGASPGYVVVPQLNAMIFATFDSNRGHKTIHVRDLATGNMSEIEAADMPRFIESGSSAASPDRWWVHDQSGRTMTFGCFGVWERGSSLHFDSIDFESRRVVESRAYDYDSAGMLLSSYRSDSSGAVINRRREPEAPPVGESVAELIGAHRAEAGLPRLPDKH